MKILFDQGTPVPLRAELPGHEIDTAYELGWQELENGRLLDAAQREGYQVLITTDQNLRYQQNLSGRSITVLILQSTSWPKIRMHTDSIIRSLKSATSGEYVEIEIK